MKLIKLFIIVLTTISTIQTNSSFAGMDKGFDSPQAAADSFLSNLKNGKSGLKDAVDLLPGENERKNNLIEESKKTLGDRPIESQLSESLGSDRLLSYRKTGQEVKFGGKLVKMYYDLYFEKSPNKQVTFLIMQPTMSGGFYIVDVVIAGKTDLNLLMGSQKESK